MDAGRKLLLIGGGGHCRSVMDCIFSAGLYRQIGIIDSRFSASVSGIPVIGKDDDLPRLRQDGWTDAFISTGSVGSTVLRRKLYQMVKEIGFSIPSIIDPTAVVANSVEIAEGVFVGKRAIVNTGVQIGKCAIINTGAIIEHDCEIGAFAHISPGAILCGQVSVGESTHIGAGSVIRQGLAVGRDALIGMGSVVVKNIPDLVKAYGNPCRAAE